MHAKNNNLDKLYSSNFVFICSFFVSFVVYIYDLHISGYGWDGDSLNSAAHFFRLINPDLYGGDDSCTHPKLLCLALLGLIYKLTGGLYVATYISILLSTTMLAVLSKWVNDSFGIWWILLPAALMNPIWTSFVLSCDNPAFSIPFLVFGLYLYYEKKFKYQGVICLVISSLFRPGGELVIFAILAHQIYKRLNWRIATFTCMAAFLGLGHTLFSTYLAYPDKTYFMNYCLYYTDPIIQRNIEKYKYSTLTVLVFIKEYLKTFVFMSFATCLALVNSFKYPLKKSISSILLVLLPPLIPLMGSLKYGTVDNIKFHKFAEIFVFVSVLSSLPSYKLSRLISRGSFILVSAPIVSIVLIFVFNVIYAPKIRYEVREDGGGVIPWMKRPEIKGMLPLIADSSRKLKVLVSEQDVTYFILDYANYASTVDTIPHVLDKQNINLCDYDVVVLRDQDIGLERVHSCSNYVRHHVNSADIFIKPEL